MGGIPETELPGSTCRPTRRTHVSRKFGGVFYDIDDLYCVEPGCTCTEVMVEVSREEPKSEDVFIGIVHIHPSHPERPILEGHGDDRIELERVWNAWSERVSVTEILSRRQGWMRSISEEIHRIHSARVAAAPVRTSKKARPPSKNKPCPCGSGRKYKSCCGREAR